MSHDRVAIGIDIGTSGVRAVAVDRSGAQIEQTSAPLKPTSSPLSDDPRGVNAEDWWRVTKRVLVALLERLEAVGISRRAVGAIAVDGTSGSVVLIGADLKPVTPGLLYNAKGFVREGTAIDAVAPPRSIARGGGSALARLLHLQSLAPEAAHLCHQADFIVARLTGQPGRTDESNALKTGYDPVARCWPDWVMAAGVRSSLLPRVHPVGAVLGNVDAGVAGQFGLSPNTKLVAGASDGTAGFLAAGTLEPGTAVTTLGTTLTLKVLADRPVEDANRGIYSHRIGDAWLPGGASNTGGGALLRHFTAEQIEALSGQIDPTWKPAFEAYPLPSRGERFPTNDADLASVDGPRPSNDARFLHALLHGIALIERDGYRALAELGAPYPKRVLTTGGGARNAAWSVMRERLLGVPVTATEGDPALGMARLALRAVVGG